MGSPTTVTMLAPNGQSGDVPVANVQAAQQAGFKVAVTMQSPDGKMGYIPAERVHDAASAGFKMVPMNVPDAAKASYWDALTNPVGAGGREQGALGGFLQVGGQAIKTMAQPLDHPIDTLEGLYNTVRHPIDTAEGMANQVKSDYAQGGVPLAAENILGQTAGAIESGRLVAPVASAAVSGVQDVARKALLLGKTPQEAMASAMRLPIPMSPAQRAAIAQTAIDEGIPVHPDSVESIADAIDRLDQAKWGAINTRPTAPIDPNAVAAYTERSANYFGQQATANPDLETINRVKNQFLSERGAAPAIPPKPTGILDAQGNPIMSAGSPAQPAPSMTAVAAQNMKQVTGAINRKKYGLMGTAETEAQKDLVYGLTQQLGKQFPELGDINSSESALIKLQPYMQRAVARLANNQRIGLGTMVAGIGGNAMLGKFGAALGVLKAVLDDPVVKSRLAISLGSAAKIPAAQALGRVANYSTQLGAFSRASQQPDESPTPPATGTQ